MTNSLLAEAEKTAGEADGRVQAREEEARAAALRESDAALALARRECQELRARNLRLEAELQSVCRAVTSNDIFPQPTPPPSSLAASREGHAGGKGSECGREVEVPAQLEADDGGSQTQYAKRALYHT